MPDHLVLSLWLRDFAVDTMLRHFEEVLRAFPFSKLRPGISALRIHALQFAEPALFEQIFAEQGDIETTIGICREFENPDCAYVDEGWWELWRHENDAWQLAPSRVSIICHGPDFDHDNDDNIRLELGPEREFLPLPGVAQGARKSDSNFRGVVRLARDFEEGLALERLSLWTESGEELIEKLDEALDDAG